MSVSERHRWFDTLKHRFLRHKNLQQKQRVLRSVDRMQKMVDEVLVENGEDLRSRDHETDAEHTKSTIRRLLASTDTRYPIELTTRMETEQLPETTAHENSLQLADLLLQTVAKSRLNLSEKVHPTFEQVDLTSEQEKWHNRKEMLQINYKDVKVCAFRRSKNKQFLAANRFRP